MGETHTYRVALIDNKIVHLTADRVESGRGRMGFYEGKKLVRSFAEAEVVGCTRES